MRSRKETSKYISLILRHRPEVIGIILDEHGWAVVDNLIAGVSKTHFLDREELEEIVRTDEKGRYSAKTLWSHKSTRGFSIDKSRHFHHQSYPWRASGLWSIQMFLVISEVR